jgi:hypothetical protein
LVEFALLAPLLIILVSQQQDVRHGAREAARLAAVDTDTGPNMATLTCSSMNVSTGAVITFGRTGANPGDTGNVSVVSPVGSLTGFSSLPFVGAIYPTTFTESISFRLEQPATWANPSGGTCP